MRTELLCSEEDVKAKVVSEWLRDHGFGPGDISLERTFQLRFGRGIHTVSGERTGTLRARCDYLVKATDGRNLMIVEVKAPAEPLDDDAKEQGISYARALRSGGIAPFTILTNGLEAKIYDSITGELLTGQTIPHEHPHARNGFRYSGEDITLRTEALNALISLSPDNLLAFCKASVDHHLRLLRSTDLDSGKKYIPQLYVPREKPTERLNELLAHSDHQAVLVTGHPQVGKTNFLCRLVEDSLATKLPCLFYPAISFRRGFLEEIAEDFEWTFAGLTSMPAIAKKLGAVLSRRNQHLLIVVDGWNEAEHQVARTLNDECQRLASGHVRFVLSMTNIAAGRLLVDKANNPTFIADAIGISRQAVPLLEMDPSKLIPPNKVNSPSIVVVEQYSSEEAKEAYKVYAQQYSVTIPENHQPTCDPFLLGMAMPLFRGATLPAYLDEPAILAAHLARKELRAGGLDASSVTRTLTKLGEEIFQSDAPVQEDILLARCRLPASESVDQRLFEAALLTRREEAGNRTIDFYYARERDFVIAQWVRQWPTVMKQASALRQEIRLALRTVASSEALLWFFSQQQHIAHLELAAAAFPQLEDERARCLLLEAAAKLIFRCDSEPQWARDLLNHGLHDASNKVRIQAVKLMALMTEDHEELAAQIAIDIHLIASLLTIDDDFPLSKGSAGQVVLDALRSLHWDSSPDSDPSPITGVLTNLLLGASPNMVRAASRAFGYLAPNVYCRVLAELLKRGHAQKNAEAFFAGIEEAMGEFGEMYYGSMCPGVLPAMKEEPEWLRQEYEEMSKSLQPIIRFYGPTRCERLLDILLDLQPPGADDSLKRLTPNHIPGQTELWSQNGADH